MACGRPKNLEIAGGNPLCGPRYRRRNFLTTGNGNRRRGNPEPLAKGETPEPPARGKPRATRQRATSSLWRGETPSHPAKGDFKPLARRNPEPPGKEETLSHLATEETPEPPGNGERPQAIWPGEISKPRQRGHLGPTGLEGPQSHPGTGEPSGHWSGENPGPSGNGTPRAHWARGTRSHRRGSLRTTGLEKPGPSAKASLVPLAQGDPPPPARGKPRATGKGIPEPPVIWATGPLVRLRAR